MAKELVFEKVIGSVEEMIDEGERFGKSLKPCVALMYGEAGVGKTHFVKGVAKSLGIQQQIVSPTYSLRIEYEGKYKLIHIDAYRLESVEEAYESGVLEDLNDGDSVAFIEWAKLVEEEIGFPRYELHFFYTSASTRELKIYRVSE